MVGAHVLGALAVSLAVACSKPEPPTLVPTSATVTTVSPAGLGMVVKVDATNPNRMALSARTVTAKVRMDGKYDLTVVTLERPMALPGQATTTLDVPLQLTWTDAGILASLAAANRTIPFTLDGTMNVGGDRLNVDVPFHVDGSLTSAQLVDAGLRSLPRIPGLTAP